MRRFVLSIGYAMFCWSLRVSALDPSQYTATAAARSAARWRLPTRYMVQPIVWLRACYSLGVKNG